MGAAARKRLVQEITLALEEQTREQGEVSKWFWLQQKPKSGVLAQTLKKWCKPESQSKTDKWLDLNPQVGLLGGRQVGSRLPAWVQKSRCKGVRVAREGGKLGTDDYFCTFWQETKAWYQR